MGRLHGADVAIDLGRQQTRVEIVVQNTTAQALEFRIGPAGAAPRNAIGQVLLRRLDGPPGAGSPDYVPYNGMQPLMVEAGWRATMYIDAPLGRDPQLGQYFVLTVEARDATGACERHLLPLTASNAGTMPADGR